MAHTCSYKIGDNEIVKDYICFAPFRNAIGKETYIIIEDKKFYFDIKQIRTYLNDLKQMGFEFTYKYNKKEKQFELNVSKFKCRYKLIAFAMAVRYLWEGYYNHKYGKTDIFYKVVEHYFKLKELFPKESKFKLLCLACNCFLAGKCSINSNHFFCYSTGCYINKSVNIKETSINNHFSNTNLKLGKIEGYEYEVKNWKDEDYYKLKQYIEDNEK